MTEQSSGPDSSGATEANECKSIDDLYAWVNGQISRFEALKLDELKTELEEFKQIQDAVPAEYKAKYDDFQKRWCAESEQIEQLRAELICSYGNDWKKIIKNAVCEKYKYLNDLKEKIENRKGVNEKARDSAQEQLVIAKTNLDAWQAITQKIEEHFSTNQSWITEIQNLNQGENRAFRLYLLWFKLLPAHNKLTPHDKQPLYPDEIPEALCKENPQQGQKVNQTQESYSESQASSGKSAISSCNEAREAPWIIKPDTYKDKLNSAFCCYKEKKEQYAKAVGEFDKDPDSLDKIVEQLEQKNSSLEADIKQALEKEASSKTTSSPCA